jgi:hypothetical protein
MSPKLKAIERRLPALSWDEQLLLLERLARRLREETPERRIGGDLAEMAADPAIQRELKAIDREFVTAESDGLENV